MPIISRQQPIDPAKLSGEYDYSQKEAIFNNKRLLIPDYLSKYIQEDYYVLGKNAKTSSKEKRIEVDLTNQRLYGFEGNDMVFNFLVSTGKWNLTPTGNFRIWISLESTLMTGGSKAIDTYYYLPNVPYVMFFYNDFGIHGTYWHDNFGHPMSHGCINMRTDDVRLLYYWVNAQAGNESIIYPTASNPGVQVIIYGQTPNI